MEVRYFIAMCELELPQLGKLTDSQKKGLHGLYQNFTLADALKIKEFEKVTNHDVKAVEYFVKEKIKPMGLEKFGEFIHFGLTSQDINNTSIPLSLKDATEAVIIPALNEVIKKIKALATEYKDISMLARTHGQLN